MVKCWNCGTEKPKEKLEPSRRGDLWCGSQAECMDSLKTRLAGIENQEKQLLEHLVPVLSRLESPECYYNNIERDLRWVWAYVESRKSESIDL